MHKSVFHSLQKELRPESALDLQGSHVAYYVLFAHLGMMQGQLVIAFLVLAYVFSLPYPLHVNAEGTGDEDSRDLSSAAMRRWLRS